MVYGPVRFRDLEESIVKVGFRTPNIEKSIKARTTGRAKRALKRSMNPLYGKKGMGFVKDPEKSIRDAVYKRTTVGVSDIARHATESGSSGTVRHDAGASGENGTNIGCIRVCIGLAFAASALFCLFAGDYDPPARFGGAALGTAISWLLLRPLFR